MTQPTQLEIDLWREEIASLKSRIATSSKKETIAFYGSSSIRLWETLGEDLSPLPVENMGFGGSSYYWCDYFYEEVFEHIQAHHVVLYAGDNDLGNNHSLDFIVENFSRLTEKIRKQFGKIPISVISVKPSPERLYLKDRIEELNKALSRTIQNEELGYFVDIYAAMLDSEKNVRPELYEEDQLHMNNAGYLIWKKVILEHLSSLQPK